MNRTAHGICAIKRWHNQHWHNFQLIGGLWTAPLQSGTELGEWPMQPPTRRQQRGKTMTFNLWSNESYGHTLLALILILALLACATVTRAIMGCPCEQPQDVHCPPVPTRLDEWTSHSLYFGHGTVLHPSVSGGGWWGVTVVGGTKSNYVVRRYLFSLLDPINRWDLQLISILWSTSGLPSIRSDSLCHPLT